MKFWGMAGPLVTDAFANVLGAALGGRWWSSPNPMGQGIEIRFACQARGGFSVSETLLEDSRHHSDVIYQAAIATFSGTHLRPFADESERLVPCSRCGRSNAVPDIEKLEANAQFEYAERMAVLWMERAASIRRLWST